MLIPIQSTPSGTEWWKAQPEYDTHYGISLQVHTYQSSSNWLLSAATQGVRSLKGDEQAGYSFRIVIVPGEEDCPSYVIATGATLDEVMKDWEYLRSMSFFDWFEQHIYSQDKWWHLSGAHLQLRKRIDSYIESVQDANMIEFRTGPSELEVSFEDQLDWVRALPDAARERMMSKLIGVIEEERGEGAAGPPPAAGVPCGPPGSGSGEGEEIEDVGG